MKKFVFSLPEGSEKNVRVLAIQAMHLSIAQINSKGDESFEVGI